MLSIRRLPKFAQTLRPLLAAQEPPALRSLSDSADPQVQEVVKEFAKSPQQTGMSVQGIDSQLGQRPSNHMFAFPFEHVADALAASLSPAQRAVLAAALSKRTEADALHEDDEYVHHLFEAADIDGERGTLTK
jgi:hypothetical protein